MTRHGPLNISSPLNRLYYWLRWYWLRWSDREPYLQYRVQKHLEEARPPREESRWADFFGSRPGAMVIAAAVLISEGLALGYGASLTMEVPDQVGEYAGILWQVEAGLLGIAFVVIVLLMQVLGGRDQLSGYVFEIYVQRSYILSIAFLGLATIGVMGIPAFGQAYGWLSDRSVATATMFNSGLLAVNLIAIGVVYHRIVQLTRPGHSIQLTKELLQENLERSIDLQVSEAIGEHVLIKKAQDWGLGYRPSFPRDGDAKAVEYPVEQKKLQVKDVDLERLSQLADSIDRSTVDTSPQAWIRARLGTTLSISTPVLGYRRSQDNDTGERLVNCYVVGLTARVGSGWDAAVDNLQKRASRAIADRKPSEFADLLAVYQAALEHYIHYVDRYDEEYWASAFERPLSLADHWRPDSVLRRDILTLAERAIGTNDRQLVGEMVPLPVRVMRTAQARGDKDVYKEVYEKFARVFVQFYREGQRLPADSAVRVLVVDGSWRHLKEEAERLELNYFDRPDRPQEITSNASYARSIIRVFSQLLKQAVNRGDYDTYDTVGDVLDAIFEDLSMSRHKLWTERHGLERELEENDAADSDTVQRIELLHEAERSLENIEQAKSLLWFGLGAWILDLFRRGKLNSELFQQLIRKHDSRFDDLEELHQIYTVARKDAIQREFRWNWWDSERHEQGPSGPDVHAVTTSTWLRRFYVAMSLQMKSSEITDAQIPPSERITFEIEKLQEECDHVLNEGHPLEELDDLEERAEAFIDVHEQAAQRQQEIEADQLIEADLDQERVDAFKQSFISEWRGGNIDRLLGPFIQVKESTLKEGEVLDDKESFFINKFVDKSILVSTSRVPERAAAHVGEQYGAGLGKAEAKRLYDTLRDRLEAVSIAEDELGDQINEAVETLQDRGYDPDFLLATPPTLLPRLARYAGFVPDWKEDHPQSELPRYVGRFEDIPATGIASRDGAVVVIDVGEAISVQRIVLDDGEPVRLELECITEKRVHELIEESPSLLDDFESEMDAIRGLQQKVYLQGETHLDFEVLDEDAGMAITIEDDDNGSTQG